MADNNNVDSERELAVRNRIREIAARELAIDVTDFKDNETFLSGWKADDIDVVSIILYVETEFDIVVTDYDELWQNTSVDTLTKCVINKEAGVGQ